MVFLMTTPYPSPPSSFTYVHRCIGYRNPNWQSLTKSVRLTYFSVYDNRDRSSESTLFEPFSTLPSSFMHVHIVQTPTLPTPMFFTFTCTQVLWFLSRLTRSRVSRVTTRPVIRFNLFLPTQPIVCEVFRSLLFNQWCPGLLCVSSSVDHDTRTCSPQTPDLSKGKTLATQSGTLFSHCFIPWPVSTVNWTSPSSEIWTQTSRHMKRLTTWHTDRDDKKEKGVGRQDTFDWWHIGRGLCRGTWPQLDWFSCSRALCSTVSWKIVRVSAERPPVGKWYGQKVFDPYSNQTILTIFFVLVGVFRPKQEIFFRHDVKCVSLSVSSIHDQNLSSLIWDPVTCHPRYSFFPWVGFTYSWCLRTDDCRYNGNNNRQITVFSRAQQSGGFEFVQSHDDNAVPVVWWLLLSPHQHDQWQLVFEISWFHHPLQHLHFFLSNIVFLLLQRNLVGGFHLILWDFYAILGGFFSIFDLLEQHHRLSHIWCVIWFVGTNFFSKHFNTSNMILLQSFPQRPEAVDQYATLTRDVSWFLLLGKK